MTIGKDTKKELGSHSSDIQWTEEEMNAHNGDGTTLEKVTKRSQVDSK